MAVLGRGGPKHVAADAMHLDAWRRLQVVVCSELLAGSAAAEGYGQELGGTPRRLVRCASVVEVLHLTGGPGTGRESSETSIRRRRAPLSLLRVRVPSVDGTAVLNMRHLVALAVGAEPDPGSRASFLTLGFADGTCMVLDRGSLRRDTLAAMQQHGVAHAMSSRLRALAPSASWPLDGGADAGASEDARSVQRRQTRRRLRR